MQCSVFDQPHSRTGGRKPQLHMSCDLPQTQNATPFITHMNSRQCSQCTAAEPSSTSASVPTLVAGVSKIITWPQPPTADRTASRTGMCDRERDTPSCRSRCMAASQSPRLRPRRGCPSAGPSSQQDGPEPGSGSSAERRRTAQKRGSRLCTGRQFTVADKHARGLSIGKSTRRLCKFERPEVIN